MRSQAKVQHRADPRPILTGLALTTALVLAQALPGHAQVNPETTTADTTQALPGAVAGRPLTFADLAAQVSPSVVNITTSTTVAGREGPQGIVPDGSPFEDFFNDLQNGPGGQPRRSSALGSGFVISADGYIVTNNHVIEGADEIEIEFFPGDGQPAEQLPATLVGTDTNTDIALLKVEYDSPLQFVEFGNSNATGARVGDWVLAMGNPLGQGFSVSAGIVSARNRALSGTYDDYIQTDAAINRGNSGGPLFNMDGEVIGVNTAILSPNGGSIGIGFAMSSAVVSNVVDQLREFGETRRGWLGVRIQDVTPDMVSAIDGLDSARGALITDVPPGPAEDAGLLSGDVILSYDGTEVTDTRELVRMVGNSAVGAKIPMQVLRNGDETMIDVTLGRRETDEATAFPASDTGPAPEDATQEMLGLTVSPVTPDLAEQYGLDDRAGLVITAVDPASDAGAKGLAEGDLITDAGQEPVTTPEELQARIDNAAEAGQTSLLLLVRRDGNPRFLALALGDAGDAGPAEPDGSTDQN
ncbi:Do family serine endopeptidase [Loktanella sp. M215]|uniref:Do family serine endopeptidase n=1 Tax=Loktanella sp. M215 TaxID=2675431 RepID=UPI001F84C2B4|nr:Do family serine endopeptidase [Loktanella sp. M215]